MSVPFPSLFSSKKKQRPDPVHDDSDDSHNDPPVTRSAAKTHTRGNMSQGNRDFATGNCMTCNSLVRWPRDLKVFKCTVCVTVNDLSPEEHAGHRSGGVPQWLRGAKPATSSSSSPPDQPARSVDKSGTKEISLEHTKFSIFKDLTSGFLTFRLIRQNEKKYEAKVDVIDGLIPNMSTGRSAASLHAALGTSSSSKKKPKEQPKKMVYHDDWQIRAAARVLALLFAANNTLGVRRADATMLGNSSVVLREGVQVFGQVLPTSDFYNSMIDYADLIADFEAWETKRSKFAFCQYPFLLSIWAKSQILEYDARRQMTTKARDAFFDSIMTRKNVTQHLTLDVRRDCLVEDSLAAVSEVIGSGGEDIKKRLRIEFRGEEGYDAGARPVHLR
ncbi:E3 ubiquitin-protein ligase mug30 like [Verticillium longisporum]|nr:E3 ubiquitin-protein ligase mug30 like [Verticillium longisporum]